MQGLTTNLEGVLKNTLTNPFRTRPTRWCVSEKLMFGPAARPWDAVVGRACEATVCTGGVLWLRRGPGTVVARCSKGWVVLVRSDLLWSWTSSGIERR
ncbi:hypothetical protein RchiOBHm_Chr2g0150721 [Rosa chinensis]|uniref:Uncharacterized protein n=1 Tax=Rosa chinensis TaxID=74649 RepID=A0A2P6RZY6_ROSCH|nr:hypothetical protein RchiOBHm_Chr2g0150721 [Rosa chinensis]